MKYPYLIFFLLLVIPSSGAKYTSWGYQLQNYNLDDLISFPADILVIDYSKDGSEEEAFTSSEIVSIKESGKSVISYISIGEAEDYRSYFKESWRSSPPSWLGEENPDWKGNYKVHYWESGWQSIIYDYIDVIMSAGFDGLYLDIIDAYEYYEPTKPDAKALMIQFVLDIANYTQTKQDEEFSIFPQNGDELLQEEKYINSISGIGREDVYIIPDDGRRDADSLREIEANLDLLITLGKTVLVVDYTDDPGDIVYARERAADHAYIHYVGVLDLDTLVDQDAITKSVPIFIGYLLLLPVLAKFRSKYISNSKKLMT